MHTLYDTNTVHPLDRYEYYRAGAAAELAPVSVEGRPPCRMHAVMSIAKIGDFEFEAVTWTADYEVLARRTERLIRTSDPGCYRIFLSVTPGVRMEQADHRVDFGARDIALYDISQPWTATHTTGPKPMQVVMLTFPREPVPIDRATVRPLIGTRTPRNLPGRGLIAQFLIGLTEPTLQYDGPFACRTNHLRPSAATDDPGLAEVLRECTVGLIRQRLGEPTGIAPHTRRLLQQARITGILRRRLSDPALTSDGIARAANISPRYLYAIFEGAELTPMQQLKRLRLQEARRRLQDPTLARTSTKAIMSAAGYLRADQFARDFRQLFGVSPTEARSRTGDQSSSPRV